MKNVLTFMIIFFSSYSALSQHMNGKIIDKNTKQPIAFSNIKTGEYTGVISNEEGYFTITGIDSIKSITISCMGYQSKTIDVKDLSPLKNCLIELEEAINELSEVFISTKPPNVDSIIAKVKLKIKDNYDGELNRYTIFHRTTDHINFKSLEFEIDKASDADKKSIEYANANLKHMAKDIKNSNMVQFFDFKGDVYALGMDSIKLKVDKAAQLLDHKHDFSIDRIQEKAQRIILAYLDTTKTYKLKTGLFKIEDSLSLDNQDFKKENSNAKVSLLSDQTKSLLSESEFYEHSFLTNILDNYFYEHEFEDMIYNDEELTYVIRFMPKKAMAKFTGTLFISDDTYAITRLDYNYYKKRHGEKVNLKFVFGIKYVANINKGTVIFEKDSSKIYYPKYLKRTTGSYFYVNRPLKLIQNSKESYKVSFDFKIEGSNLQKEELLISAKKKLTLDEFKTIKQDSIVSFKILNKYEKTIWQNESILEPSMEMKQFKGE